MNKPLILQLEIGPMQNFCYFLGDPKSKDVLMVDPGWDSENLKIYLKDNFLNLKGILLTHHHYDHVNAVEEILTDYDVPIHMLDKEASYYGFTSDNLKTIKNEELISIGDYKIKALHTPGHTVGSTSFLFDGHLITGDTLFINGCGRCDLPGGNPEEMYLSLKKFKENLNPSTVILPGHDYAETPTEVWSKVAATNPYLQISDLESFIKDRM